MESSAHQTNSGTQSTAILQRIHKADRTAVEDCVEAYGNLVWALAKKYTDSLEEAEAATQEIFLDIWRYAGHCDPTKSDEVAFICLIARRRLIKRL
jgi:DNA-directed RNA polymerase specialized sigma24 family protein